MALGKTFFPLGTPVFSSGKHRLNGHLARLLEVERTQVNGLDTACYTAVTVVVVIDVIIMALLGNFHSWAEVLVRSISGQSHGEWGLQAAVPEKRIVKKKTVP